MAESRLILVDEQDNPVGVAEKIEAHRQGWLHRAFSIFIFNSKGEMLLQQRAMHKYHSGGLWTNACCSHPSPEEDIQKVTRQRLNEEMGIDTKVSKIFDFIYRASFENGLIEYEFDHVFVGEYNGPVTMNAEEVMDHRFDAIDKIQEEIAREPEKFSVWFQQALPRVVQWWKSREWKK